VRNQPDAVIASYALRADFKFDIYDSLFLTDRTDSYLIVGNGTDAINRAIVAKQQDGHCRVLVDDGSGWVLDYHLEDLQALLASFVAVYGYVAKAGSDEPKYV
jgi:hypothetical protein